MSLGDVAYIRVTLGTGERMIAVAARRARRTGKLRAHRRQPMVCRQSFTCCHCFGGAYDSAMRRLPL